MMTTDRKGDPLEPLFEAARAEAPQPSAELMARILADAQAHLPTPTPAPVAAMRPVRAVQPVRRGWLAGLLAALGGWPSVAGMATATVAGLWLGFAQPEALTTLSGGALLPGATAETYELEELIPTYGRLDGLLSEDG